LKYLFFFALLSFRQKYVNIFSLFFKLKIQYLKIYFLLALDLSCSNPLKFFKHICMSVSYDILHLKTL
jgi:hypothetical protein